jgi:hypothetical protein
MRSVAALDGMILASALKSRRCNLSWFRSPQGDDCIPRREQMAHLGAKFNIVSAFHVEKSFTLWFGLVARDRNDSENSALAILTHVLTNIAPVISQDDLK